MLFEQQSLTSHTSVVALNKGTQIKTSQAVSAASQNEEILSPSHGGPGGNPYKYSFGRRIVRITTKVDNKTKILRQLIYLFDDGTTIYSGGLCKDNEMKTSGQLDLTNDIVSEIYVRVQENEDAFGKKNPHTGVTDIYITTRKGQKFKAVEGGKSPNDSTWQLVTDREGRTLMNFQLAGIHGADHDYVDRLGFICVNDELSSRVIEDFDYSNLQLDGSSELLNLSTVSLSNASDTDQSATVSFSESIGSGMTWSSSESLSLGLSTTLTTGIPFVGDAGVEVSTEKTISSTWGEETSLSQDFSYNAQVNVPANSKMIADAVVSKQKLSGTFSAKLLENWQYGGVIEKKITGDVRGASAYNVAVKYSSGKLK